MSHWIIRVLFFPLLSIMFLIGSGSAPARAADPQPPGVKMTGVKMTGSNRVTLDFREIELTDLIQMMSELTGKNFLYDETVKGKVTVVSPEGLSLDEAYQLFQTVLGLKGFTVVPSGKANKIVAVKNAKESNLPIVTEGQLPSEQYITRLLRLENLDAASIADTVLAPLIPATGNIVVYSPTNTLIITDSANNIDRLARIISELDQPGSARILEVITLTHAGAEDVARVCNEIIIAGSGAGSRRGRADGTPAVADFLPKILAYARTNVLIVMASAEQLFTIRELVAKMDQNTGGGYSSVNVYPLENADAETLAKTMNEILTGIRAENRPSGPGKGPGSTGPVTITADKPTNSLIINAKLEDYASLKGIIERLDVKRKQVYVEALIMELSMDATVKLGVSLQGAGTVDDDGLVFGNSNFDNSLLQATGVNSLLGKAVDGLLAGGFFNPITVTGPDGSLITVPSLSVLINLSKTDGDVNILSAPRLLTSDNEEAEILVGSNVPIITNRLTDTTNTGAQSVAIERKDVALILRFTPQVTEGNLVRLNVYQEMTDIVPGSAALAASVGNPRDVGPTFTKRVLRNTVIAESGRTIVLGGLIGTNVSETVTKVPLLGDIPLLGWLFKHTSTEEKKTNLLVFINPTIIRGPEDLANITRRNRQVADGLMTERLRPALPENYFAPGEALSSAPVAPDALAAPSANERARAASVSGATAPAVAVPVPSVAPSSAGDLKPPAVTPTILQEASAPVATTGDVPPTVPLSPDLMPTVALTKPAANNQTNLSQSPVPRVLDEKWSTPRPQRASPL